MHSLKSILKFIFRFIISIFVNFLTKSKTQYNSKLSLDVLNQVFQKKIKCNFGSAYISGNVEIHNNVTLFNQLEIFGNIKLSKNVSISGPGTRICSSINNISIGSYCSIASNVIIQEYNHNPDLITTYDICENILKLKNPNSRTSKGSIIIEEDVWIGSNSVILSGVKIGRGSIIGSGSIVTKDILPYSIAVGNPCKRIKSRFSQNKIDELESLKWWEWDENKLIKNKDIFYER